MRKPSYPKEMKERAEKDKKDLVSVDVPGLWFQGPVTIERTTELLKLLNKWFRQDRKNRENKKT